MLSKFESKFESLKDIEDSMICFWSCLQPYSLKSLLRCVAKESAVMPITKNKAIAISRVLLLEKISKLVKTCENL